MATNLYRVKGPITYGDKFLDAGDSVEMPEADAAKYGGKLSLSKTQTVTAAKTKTQEAKNG